MNPNPMEAAEQLYLEHPHILKQDKIPKERIAALIQDIQRKHKIIGDYDDEEQEEDEEYEEEYQHEEEELEHV